MTDHTVRVDGPFTTDSFGEDWVYVVSESGVRMAECDGDDAAAKAEQICDALNAMHYIAQFAANATGAQQ